MPNLVVSSSMLLAAIPVVLVLALGRWVASKVNQVDQNHTWVLFLLGSATLMALPFAIFSENFFTHSAGLLLFLVLPALEGILALALINWRLVYQVWVEQKRLATLLLLALFLILALAALKNPNLLLLLVLPALIVALVWTLGSRLAQNGLVITAALLALFLFADALGILGSHYVYNLPWLLATYKFSSGLGAVLAVFAAALCLKRGLEVSFSGEQNRSGLYLPMSFLLILGVLAVTIRHGALVEATGRAAEDHLPFAVIAAALIAGLLLVLTTDGRLKVPGYVYMILVPATISLSFVLGLRVDFQAVTDQRATQIGQALERFSQDNGEYPDALSSLTPGYLPIILGPLTGRGQIWCYQSGPSYYQLGYVYFQRYYQYDDGTPFYEPYYTIKVPQTVGETPAGSWICDEELERFKLHGGL